MTKTRAFMAALLVAAVAAAGCGTTTYYNTAYANKLKLGDDKFLIMPVEFNGFPDDMRVALEVIIFAQFLATFGKYGVSLQPVKPAFEAAGFGNLSRHLAQGIYHVASVHRNPYLAKDRCEPYIGPMVASLAKFVNWVVGALRAAGAPIPEDYKFEYVLVAYVDRLGKGFLGKGMQYRVVGGLVNAQTQEIVAATWFVKTSMDNKAAYVASLGTLGRQLLKAFKPVFVDKKKKG